MKSVEQNLDGSKKEWLYSKIQMGVFQKDMHIVMMHIVTYSKQKGVNNNENQNYRKTEVIT